VNYHIFSVIIINILLDFIAEASFAILCSRMSEYKLRFMHTKELNVMIEVCVEWDCFFNVLKC